ncbi:hypothetical protein Tco_1350107, partial [Tanacetum coccineum]
AKDSIATKTCELLKEEFNDFLTLYPIPFEYRVILPKSNQTAFDAPPGLKSSWEHGQQRLAILVGGKEMAFRNFIYTEDDEDLSFLPKEPSLGLSTGSLSVLVNTEPLKADKELVIQPAKVTADSGESLKPELFVVHPRSIADRIKDRKCTTRGGSSSPPIRRKLALGSLTSRATRAKTSSSKEDVPFLTVFDDDEGLPDVLELKDATICHLKISDITPPAWKNHLDNHIYLELLDLHDRCYARQAVANNAVNRRSRELLQVKCEAVMTEFEKNPAEVALREKISALSTEVKEHKLNLDMMMLESQKWAGYQQSLLTLESKVTSLEAEKERLEAIEVSLRKEVADMKEPFDLSKVKGYRSSYKKDHTQASNDLATATFPWLDEFVADPLTPIKTLLSKKPPTLQRPAPLRTQVPLPSFQRATPSFVPVSNLMSPPTDASVMKPQCSQLH